MRSRQGKAFRIFTPFWREARALVPDASPLAAPLVLESPPTWPAGEKLSALSLLPSVNRTAGLHAVWRPGEAGAIDELARFLQRVDRYGAKRDYPSEAGTSRLSPHLHFGELSVRTVWSAVRSGGHLRDVRSPDESEPFLRQLGWREFAHHVLYNCPHTTTEPSDATMRSFPWASDEDLFQRWSRGMTGYPIVDAGMRELWQTGWMHNRARMVMASFLVKDLLCDWRRGAAWFWDTLVDADLANNTLGWQWAAGCGADAAPYFRIFNPVLQGQKFDPRGAYVRRWIPELARLPDEWVHTPWKAPARTLQDAGIILDRDYLYPIVDHADARTRALAALAAVRSQAPQASARGVRK